MSPPVYGGWHSCWGSARHDTWSYGLRLLTHRQLLFTTHTQEVLSLSRYSHRGGALPFLGYSGLDISFASSISQAMYGCRPAVMVATPLFMASRNHTALSCLLLNTYYSHTGMGGRAGRRQGQSVGTGQQQGPAGGSVETFRSKRVSRMTTLCSVQCLL